MAYPRRTYPGRPQRWGLLLRCADAPDRQIGGSSAYVAAAADTGAELYGYVNRSLPDRDLDAFVDSLATRIAAFDKQATGETKRFADVASLPLISKSHQVGCVPRLNRTPSRTGEDRDIDGARLSQTRGCRNPLGLLRRTTRALSIREGMSHHYSGHPSASENPPGPHYSRSFARETLVVGVRASWERVLKLALVAELADAHA